MQGIYTYIPETNCVPREYSVAAILLLLFMVLTSVAPVLNLLYFYISTFRSMCAVPNVALFCSSWTSCFPGMLLTYFLNVFEIVPVAPIIIGITFVFYIPHALYFCCKVFIIIIIIIHRYVIKSSFKPSSHFAGHATIAQLCLCVLATWYGNFHFSYVIRSIGLKTVTMWCVWLTCIDTQRMGVSHSVPCQPDRLLAFQVVSVCSDQTAWHRR